MTHVPSVPAGPLTCLSYPGAGLTPLSPGSGAGGLGLGGREWGLSLHLSSSGQEDHSATDMLPLPHTLLLLKAGQGSG